MPILPEAEATALPVPEKPTFREGVLPGVYANQIQQFESQFETTIDFQQISISEYVLTEQGGVPPQNLTLTREVVARVILPRGNLQTFILSYLRNNPAFAEAAINNLKSGQSQ
jgi:hypothetical protein